MLRRWALLGLVACTRPDADADGLDDAAEAAAGSLPGKPDSDDDGLRDGEEVKRGTHPLKSDSDGDGAPDGYEVEQGTDPLASSSRPAAPQGPQPKVKGGAEPPPEWQCGRPSAVFWTIPANCYQRVPGGTFAMGAQATAAGASGYDPEADPNEAPVRQVQVAPLWLQANEVNAALYGECVKAGWCSADEVLAHAQGPAWGDPVRERHPLQGVSWEGAARLCAWIGGRLPTEAEWEWAARGADGRRFPWGDEPSCGEDPLRVGRSPQSPPTSCAFTGTRGTEDGARRSAHGLRHMGGNVWEWTADWYGPYDPAQTVDPPGPPTGTHRVQRGGGWTVLEPRDLRAAVRAAVPPAQKLPDAGVRCAWGPAAR